MCGCGTYLEIGGLIMLEVSYAQMILIFVIYLGFGSLIGYFLRMYMEPTRTESNVETDSKRR